MKIKLAILKAQNKRTSIHWQDTYSCVNDRQLGWQKYYLNRRRPGRSTLRRARTDRADSGYRITRPRCRKDCEGSKSRPAAVGRRRQRRDSLREDPIDRALHICADNGELITEKTKATRAELYPYKWRKRNWKKKSLRPAAMIYGCPLRRGEENKKLFHWRGVNLVSRARLRLHRN